MISILMPAFNAEKHIAAAIQSVIMQKKYCKIELLICDDGSTDQTMSIINFELNKEQYQNVIFKIFQFTNNQGVSAARNHLLTQVNSASKFISFLDADDVLLPEAYQPALDAMAKHPNIQMVFAKMHMVPSFYLEQGGKISDEWPILSGITLSTGLFRKDIVLTNGLFDTTMSHGEDLDFLLRIAENCDQRLHLNHILFYYRRHNNNATLNAKSLQTGVIRAIMLHTIRRKKNPSLLDVSNLFKDESPDIIAKVRKLHERT